MKYILGLAAGVVALAGLMAMPSPQAEAKPIEAVALNRYLCTALSTIFGTSPLACSNVATFDINIENTTDTTETDNDGTPQPHDLAGLDLDGNQMSEIDGELFVLVQVSNDDPVRISIENGLIKDRAGVIRGKQWICGLQPIAGDDTDVDCIKDAVSTFSNKRNSIVVFSIVPDPNGERGPGLLTISQDRYPLDIPFLVTGEVKSVSFTNLQTTLQVGADGGSLTADGESRCNPKTLNGAGACTTDTRDDDCIFVANAAALFAANDTPERTISLVRAFDSDGTSITGAFVHWQSDNTDIGTVATGLTPTIDLGTFGYGAPNIACGTDLPGTFKLKATTTPTQKTDGGGADLDPAADRRSVTSEFVVVGAPAKITLTASPSPVDCNGTNTSTITAAVTDAAGTKAMDGTKVNFDLQVLGTANPINGKTLEGSATTIVTPLTGNGRGVPVTATVGGGITPLIQNQILVNCAPAGSLPAGTTPGGTTPGGGTSPGGTTPGGTIQGPDTGTGFTDVDNRSAMPVSGAVALFIGAMLLIGTRYGLRRNG